MLIYCSCVNNLVRMTVAKVSVSIATPEPRDSSLIVGSERVVLRRVVARGCLAVP